MKSEVQRIIISKQIEVLRTIIKLLVVILILFIIDLFLTFKKINTNYIYTDVLLEKCNRSGAVVIDYEKIVKCEVIKK